MPIKRSGGNCDRNLVDFRIIFFPRYYKRTTNIKICRKWAIALPVKFHWRYGISELVSALPPLMRALFQRDGIFYEVYYMQPMSVKLH